MNPIKVKNELNEALSRLDEAYDHIRKAMAYADGETYNELEDIRKRLVNVILDIDKVIERVE
jgi:flagellar hook-associated protein FlgK